MLDLVCNDPSACSQDQRNYQPISIFESAFIEIYTSESTNTDSQPSEDMRPIEFDAPYIIANIPTCIIDENVQSVPVNIENVHVNEDIVNLQPIPISNTNSFPSGFEVDEPSAKIPPFEIDGLALDTDLLDLSVPNFSLEIDFKDEQLQPVGSDFQVESREDLELNTSQESSGIPDSDEIQIVQFVTANNSSLTITSLLPHEAIRHPTVIEVYSCEYCERKFTSEAATHAHIFDIHLESKEPVFQVQESITFLRNYPAPACLSCRTGFLTLNLLNKHCQRLHSGDLNKFACSICNFDFPALNDFFTHRCTNEMPVWKPFKCDVCEECFVSFELRASHDCDGPPIFERDLCPDELQSVVLLPSLDNLLELTLPPLVEDLDILSCIYCSEKFPDEEQLAQHIIQLHLSFDINPYNRKCLPKRKSFSSCKECGLIFASSAARLSHSCLHSSNQNQNTSQTHISVSLPSDLDAGMNDQVELSANPQSDGLQNVQIENLSGTLPIPPATSPNQDVSLSPQASSQNSTVRKKSRKCSFQGCSVIKTSKKALSIHRFPSLPPPPDSLQAIPVSPVEPESCPSHPLRSGDTLHLLFPIFNPTDCTEENCVFKSRGKTWHSIKCSLLRHLRTAHHFTSLITVHWCATCASRIKQPKKHQCLTPGVMINIKIDGAFPCTEDGCTDEFPSELGLRNHLTAHKKASALANATQRVIPKMGPKKFKRKKKVDLPVPDLPDESITDPVFALAPPPEDVNPSNEDVQDDVPVPGPLSIYIEHIEDIINQDPSQEFFEYFCQAIEMAVVEVQNISFQPPPSQPADQNIKRSRKDIDVTDPQACQTLFNRNPKRAVREICEGPPIRCQIPVNIIEDHFKSAWDAQHPVLAPLPPVSEERTPILERNFSITEVSKKTGRIPPSWKRTVTILIPKKNSDLDNPANWRPIALSNTIYKIFTKVLAGRLSDWYSKFSALSHCQKGFTPFDGVLEHNFVLQTRLEHARAQNKDLCVDWLDVTNAFGAVPHQLIYNALSAAGSGEQFINIIKDIYTDCHTSILSNDASTNPIKINSGVKQGCPISGLLFNISIDHILRKVQGNASEHQILAFADDLCLLGSSADELQDMLDVVQSEMSNIGLALNPLRGGGTPSVPPTSRFFFINLYKGSALQRVNPSKSFSFHFSGSTPVRVEHSTFRLGSDLLTPIEEFNFTKFLGKPVGFNPVPDYDTFNNFGITAKKLLASQLSAWQKIQALKMFFFPALQFVMRTGQFKKEDWSLLDDAIRHAVKEVLYLPENASNEYIYGHVRSGCVGLPIAAEESDLNRIDSAFKLLTSKDSILADLALKHLTNSASSRMQKINITDDDLANFMSGDLEIDENDRPHSNPYSNVWTVARVASRRMKAEWLFNEGIPQIKFKDITIKSSARRKVLFSIRNRLRQDRALALTSDQGRIMECIAQSLASSHFLLNGQYLRFSEYRFIHRARLNLLPLNGLQRKETTYINSIAVPPRHTANLKTGRAINCSYKRTKATKQLIVEGFLKVND
ncbi:Retrovirus-related Pol polyprotein from type-1 retrotransposable element R2 [Araneus ventricosus]|uniref:Retrovirus-related Pol polyprotein from type-1 retrotransposable element R2 n=1 Tax=Araneus ventricosus TaxID=182803 RepID=A0A4Y2RE16_ARAVE|nr:Retrovirus-related Pol polyprotein from type-1 retrotransposable element R2 [Araneus ventricosus]